MSEPAATLQLQYPITFKSGESITELRFRRVKMKDMKNLPKDDVSSAVMLVARLTGEPPSTIDELDAMDMDKAKEILQDFLPKSPETGEQSSGGSPIE